MSIIYRKAGDVHVFISPDLQGLHVGAKTMRQAFSMIPDAVSGLVELSCGVKADYEPSLSYEEFKTQVRHLNPILTVKIDHHAHS
ncbi:MAG: hypothetical protein HQL42_00240 [Alphaproteobacteria bacterium]|nr:hypothetical protein [Alphaproteobacteria bacterium]